MKVYDIVIVGRNVSALTAVLYASMSKRPTLLLEYPQEKHGAKGVNLYPGYHEGDYTAFYRSMQKQLAKFEFYRAEEDINGLAVTKQDGKIILHAGSSTIETSSLVISTKEVLDMVKASCRDLVSESEGFFLCGNASGDDTELVSLAGKGAMAALDTLAYVEGKY